MKIMRQQKLILNEGLLPTYGHKTIAIYIRLLSSAPGVCPNCAVALVWRILKNVLVRR